MLAFLNFMCCYIQELKTLIYAYHTNQEKTNESRNELMFLYAAALMKIFQTETRKPEAQNQGDNSQWRREMINSDQEKAAEFKETMMKLLGAVGDVIHISLSHAS